MSLRTLRTNCDRIIEDSGIKRLGNDDRNDFINDCYLYGGKKFVEAISRYGCNERGEALKLRGWYLEYLEFIGDFRISVTYTDGCSQLGKHWVTHC